MRVTTSWDDGNALDLRLAELLNTYGVKGTFYIPKKGRDRSLSDEEVKRISDAGFEIGAHTLTHRELTTLSLAEAKEEIRGSKAYLEDLLGREVKMFCFPRGKYDGRIVALVREAGFTGARTVEAFTFHMPTDPFFLGTTLQVFPFPFNFTDRGKITLRQNFLFPLFRAYRPLREIRSPLKGYLSFQGVAEVTLKHAERIRGVWHLWGHSWEIEQFRMWRSLEKVFECLKTWKAVSCTNGELLRSINEHR
ncbi:MAG TPA: polysaccharide deacetylase family protein [Thermodesulfobacteriota bacterium]|nr:polysaccharide deacetylase family protein [Thermodesulfobacteriota bacterium]